MKLREYMEELRAFVKNNGPEVLDMEVIYAKDDEGNAYHKVAYGPSLVGVEDLDTYYIEVIEPEDFDGPELNAVIIN